MTRRDPEPTKAASADERFESGAREYAAYLETVEGRLRLDLAWENFRAVASELGIAPTSSDETAARSHDGPTQDARESDTRTTDAREPDAQATNARTSDAQTTSARATDARTPDEREPRALDLGCGTGALALRLAREGWRVSAADASRSMIEIGGEAARRAGLDERIEFRQLDAERAAEFFGPRAFDAALCHNVLEYVESPAAVLRALGRVLRPGGLVSLVARNRGGEALRDAVRRHDLDSAERALAADTVNESLYGGPARLFDADSLRALASDAGLEAVALRGVRVVADYLPPALSETPAAYARLLAFESKLGTLADFAPVARYLQLFARARGN